MRPAATRKGTTPLIDTLELKTGLLDGGIPEAQASASVEALANDDTGQLTTKADLAEVRTEIETLRAEMNGEIEALNGKANLLLAFNTPLLFAVLALSWKAFFATTPQIRDRTPANPHDSAPLR